MSGEADDIQITLEDRQGLWKADWLPEKGDTLDVTIKTQYWHGNTVKELPLGLFEIDELEASGQPEEVKIKAVSVPNNSALRGVDKSRAWEKTKLSVIAKDIADGAGMKLFYSTEDLEIDRAEQTQQSDLSFLMQLCRDKGLALKISDKQIIIFDEEKFEKAAAVGTIVKKSSALAGYSIRSQTREIYAACHVKYQNTENKEVVEATYTVPEKKGKTLEVNEEVKSIAEAEKLSKKKLREKNKDEITVSLTLVGADNMAAGNVFNLQGFGAFDGRYIVVKAGHTIGGGYVITVDMRRCLDGY
ncbi:MAG: contractile injection system protein, VgrG/Pvc8 family [Acidaminococcaceae bacterium]